MSDTADSVDQHRNATSDSDFVFCLNMEGTTARNIHTMRDYFSLPVLSETTELFSIRLDKDYLNKFLGDVMLIYFDPI